MRTHQQGLKNKKVKRNAESSVQFHLPLALLSIEESLLSEINHITWSGDHLPILPIEFGGQVQLADQMDSFYSLYHLRSTIYYLSRSKDFYKEILLNSNQKCCNHEDIDKLC